MSKQSEAKKNQGYIEKPEHPICSNCKHYRSQIMEVRGFGNKLYHEEKRIRCGLGGFAVKKMGVCDMHSGKTLF